MIYYFLSLLLFIPFMNLAGGIPGSNTPSLTIDNSLGKQVVRIQRIFDKNVHVLYPGEKANFPRRTKEPVLEILHLNNGKEKYQIFIKNFTGSTTLNTATMQEEGNSHRLQIIHALLKQAKL